MTKHLGEALLWLLYPRHCPLCDARLTWNEEEICAPCAERTEPSLYRFPRGSAAFPYRGEIRESVHRFKYGGRAEYAAFYASAILHACGTEIRAFRPEACLPVPIHPARFRERGYDQSEELARHLAKGLRIPCLSRTVVRRKNTVPQNALGPEERKRNLAGAFAVRGNRRIPARVLLVDDIRTTGSTLAELERVVREHGARDVYAACICLARPEEDSL